MENLPVEVIGIILSSMASARSVAMASATCRKWHAAAKHHLQKLTFDRTDFSSNNVARDRIIAKMLMRTTFLQELSIDVVGSNDTGELAVEPAFEFGADSVAAWLQHTNKTLKSLTFKHPIKSEMNFLAELCRGGSDLKVLNWWYAYLPSIDPTIHRFEALVSLTVLGFDNRWPAWKFEALLACCPKLESLSLIEIYVWQYMPRGTDPPPVIIFKSSSLKFLHIARWYQLVSSIILHVDCLKSLWLKNVEIDQVKLVDGCESGSLQCLKIEEARIRELDLGRSMDEFHLHGWQYHKLEWARYHLLISSSSNLQKLYLSGEFLHGFDIGFHKIASLLPPLSFLALDYEHASMALKGCGSAVGLILESITIVELATFRFNKQLTKWIAKFVQCCPNLKHLFIMGKITGPKARPFFTPNLAEFSSQMIEIMRPYPDIKYEVLLSPGFTGAIY